MKLLLLIATSVVLVVPSLGQDDRSRFMVNEGQITKNWRIFFSPHNRKDTFLLDTVLGTPWQLAKDKQDHMAFQSIPVVEWKAPSVVMPGTFEIIYSPYMRMDTFLLNSNSGAIWQLSEDKDGNASFQPLDRLALDQ